ncbi:mitochondrial small ribosomal subunit Rsm22-domain-containing protein [Emericellopsis atlantica]|uniref:Mitochondrial small ribosomal subunit Rsm22-domain-containing protein n=1 Tax=Emericellopsis atlantica TaxID=2614577 RepID=A0A9P8CTM0_9HYPO|nr:mitochondrial small ribosomal subunit Rsm22-domain-containing protein [Emericellopsis atlantica]KAG9258537.1 mitochondrial small ribosomal subunit Rsm22-domain-containing protein [Emericellopsis atlantica]
MLSARGIRYACTRPNQFATRRSPWISASSVYIRRSRQPIQPQTTKSYLSTSKILRQEDQTIEDAEKVVRDAKQRFRDTLPKDYLSPTEYALYVRLFGPPLRETSPEDVGIDTHADMAGASYKGSDEGTVLKELKGGEFEEITYKIAPKEAPLEPDLEDLDSEARAEDLITEEQERDRALEEQLQEEAEAEAEAEDEAWSFSEEEIETIANEQGLSVEEVRQLAATKPTPEQLAALEEHFGPSEETEGPSEEESAAIQDMLMQASQLKAPNLPMREEPASLTPQDYIDAVARNPREAKAMRALADDFARTQKEQQEAEERMEAEKEEGEVVESQEEASAKSWPEEFPLKIATGELDEGFTRFHPYTVDGSFHGKSMEIALPNAELVQPISELLRRSHIRHVREAAEASFGGSGLPLSPETVYGLRSGSMGGVGLSATQRHMTEVEADAFLAGFMPAAYASVYSIVREVRRRLGSEWIQSKLKSGGGLSVLDVGTGGAGIIAWEQILNAEWRLLKEKGEVEGDKIPGRKTVIVASDRLRNRVKSFLDNTTFLPRLPDYEHSGEMKGERLDGGGKEQPRKSYDVIISSHMLLREKETHRRQAILNNLWNLLRKDGGVLVMQEKAHPRGFEAIAHARHNVLYNFLLPPSGEPRISPEEFNPAFHREPEPGHVVAPCTNQGLCPMYVEPGQGIGRKDFCHFSQRFIRPNFYVKMLRKQTDNQGDVQFSYFAVQRGVPIGADQPTGKRATELAKEGYENAEEKPNMLTLPRLVNPALKRKGHVTMDVCTPAGKIERWTVPKSFSKLAYHDARKTRWGDLWALGAKTTAERPPRNGKPVAKAKLKQDSKKKGRKSVMGDEADQQQRRKLTKEERQKAKLEQMEALEREHDEAVDEMVDADIGLDEDIRREMEREGKR